MVHISTEFDNITREANRLNQLFIAGARITLGLSQQIANMQGGAGTPEPLELARLKKLLTEKLAEINPLRAESLRLFASLATVEKQELDNLILQKGEISRRISGGVSGQKVAELNEQIRLIDIRISEITEHPVTTPFISPPEPFVEPTEPEEESTEPETVFANVFNSAGEIISSGPMLMSNVLRLRAAGQRVDIITESEVIGVPVPIQEPQNPFYRDRNTGEQIFLKEIVVIG